MAFGSFFKLPRHREFEFRPRYYDADKEEFEKRVRKAELEAKGSSERAYVPNIKGKMRSKRMTQKVSASPYQRIRRIIVIITVALLMILFYFFLNFFNLLEFVE